MNIFACILLVLFMLKIALNIFQAANNCLIKSTKKEFVYASLIQGFVYILLLLLAVGT